MFRLGPPAAGGKDGTDSESGADHASDVSSNLSDSTVGKELAKEDDAVSPGATPDASDTDDHVDMLDAVEEVAPVASEADPGAAEVVPVPVAPLDVAGIVPPPAFAVGVETAEVSPTSHAKCFGCGEKVLRGSVRFKYWTTLKLFKYLHSTCFEHVPLAHVAHSRACLEHCHSWLIGPDEHKVRDAIRAALGPP